MYLKSLELLGFKSFAQKTVFTFDRGVTSIVGPNGCGKSNVLDAIRWVLGEQSAKALRGGEMSDVIFSGTDSQPALGMAEVSLTFSDCEKDLGVEWNEVRITRRIFRDGNSEYLLNKTPSRLRDIQQLFMDTGVGRSAYSIMEQGKIDLVLSARAEDRRAVFEEAAGITKYKTQKKEALRKLEYTEANLLRLGDIIKEIKRQIGSLQRQAAKARRYQALMDNLRTLDTHSSRMQLETLQNSIAAIEFEASSLEETQRRQESEIEEKELQISSTRRQLDSLEQTISDSRQTVQNLRSHIANAESRVELNLERHAELTLMIDRYERDIAAAEEKLRVQQTQIDDADLELEEILQTLELEQQRLEEKMREANNASGARLELESELQSLFASITRAESRQSVLRSEIAAAQSQRLAAESRLGILGEELETLRDAGQRLGTQNSEIGAQLENSARQLQEAQQFQSQAETELQTLRQDLDLTTQKIASEHRKLAEVESKLSVLRQLNEEGEGFTQGTQAVLRGLDNPEFFKPAILGALATQIEVERQFIAAIEAALAHNLQTVLVKDDAVAEAALKTLTAHSLGRASLAPRNFAPAAPDTPGFVPEGAIGWAVEHVKIADGFKNLISWLLNEVLLVPDVDAALRLRESHPHLSFVTLEGEAISAEGVIEGGKQSGNGNSVLHRNLQIGQLESEAILIQERLRESEAQAAVFDEQSQALESHFAAIQAEIQTSQLLASTLRGQQSMIERETHETNSRTEALTWEQENLLSRQQEDFEKKAALDQELDQIEADCRTIHSRRKELEEALEKSRDNEAELMRDLNELRIKAATEKQRYSSLSNQRQPMTARLQELRELIAQRQRDIEGYGEKSSNLVAESERIRAEVDATKHKAGEAEERVNALVKERADVAQKIDAFDSELRILRRQLSESHDQRGRLEVKQTQIQLRMENLCEHVTRRYQIDLREFEPDSYTLLCTLRDQSGKGGADAGEKIVATETEPAIDWTQVETLVKELEQRVDSMGPINVEAIQEYEELEQRHSFLENQLNDLARSKQELLDLIAKINTTTRKLFAETFEQVRINFQEMFAELFGGGKANLLLLDESDPLESGIDIIAKPPGKQLQSISLLSGGEKTMTAVALLFAIYMVKPSPFCVLDEMDAPLDESNINRFIKILNRFAAQSQFVVITHNKRTIARADVLYGVTMEEHGISKLVGVQFSRREDSAAGEDIIGTTNPAAIPSIAESFGKSDELQSERVQAG